MAYYFKKKRALGISTQQMFKHCADDITLL